MDSKILSWLPLISIVIILSLFIQFPLSLSNPDQFLYQSCNSTFNCGSITGGVDYPFRGNAEPDYCGYPGLVLNCQNNFPTIAINNITYRVLDINQTNQTMKIAREDVLELGCPEDLVNTTLDNSLFQFASSYTSNLTFLYGCQSPLYEIPVMNFNPVSTCNVPGYTSVYLVPGTSGRMSCNISVAVPVDGWVTSVNSTELELAVRGGFEIKWEVDNKACSECSGSKGRCGHSPFTNQSTCYCPDPPYVGNTCSAITGAPAASKRVFTNCGNIQGLMYPFWGMNRADYCGLPGFELECEDNIPKIKIVSKKYRIQKLDAQQMTMVVARDDLWSNICPARFVNTTIDPRLFNYTIGFSNITLFYGYTLTRGPINFLSSQYNCTINGTNVNAYYAPMSATIDLHLGGCNSSVIVQVSESAARALQAKTTTIVEALDGRFMLYGYLERDQISASLVCNLVGCVDIIRLTVNSFGFATIGLANMHVHLGLLSFL